MPGPSVTAIRSFVSGTSISPDGALGEHWSIASNPKLRRKRPSLPFPAAQEGELLKQVHVLLVLEQCAVQRRDQFLGVALAQRLWRDVLVEQKLEPVEQLRSRRFLFQSRRLAQREERPHGLFHQPRLGRRIMRFDYPEHLLGVGKADVVKEAAAQEGIGQLLLVVGGEDEDGPQARLDRLSGLVDVKLHLIEF